MKKFLIFFFALFPMLVAVAYDAYLYYQYPEETFLFSELGWVWQHLHEASHNAVFEYVGRENWEFYLLPFLSLKTIIAAGVFGLIVVGFAALVNILKTAANSRFTGKNKKNALGRDRSQGTKKMVYKRK
jgi:hypothetical protein